MNPKIKNFYILIFFSLYTLTLNAFNSLTEIKEFTNQNIENPSIDNNDYLFPNYTSFYEKASRYDLSNLLNTLLTSLNIKNEIWSISQFNKLLVDRINKHQSLLITQEDFVVKFTPTEEASFIIWGNLTSSFHSLARSLEELHQLKILDNDLKLTPNNYLVFNGNVIGRSPYILETFTVILSLISKNPESVLFIKGEFETKGNWKNYNLKRELQYKAKGKLNQKDIKKNISSFFKTLPLALYIDIKGKDKNKDNFIRISHYDRSYTQLDEKKFAKNLDESSAEKIKTISLAKAEPSPEKYIEISAIIKNQKRQFFYQKTDGLLSLLPDKGSTAWEVFSWQNLSSKELYNFNNDAFAILKIIPEKHPIIELYYQNAMEKNGFATKAYDLISAQLLYKTEIKKDTEKDEPKDILVGTTMDLTSKSAEISIRLLEGLNLRIDKENEKGGIDGKKIKLIHFDNKFDPDIAKQNIKNLSNKGIEIILGAVGSYPILVNMPLLEKENMLLLFPRIPTPAIFNPNLKQVINILPSFKSESLALFKYLIENLNIRKFLFFYQDDPDLKSVQARIRNILKEKFNLEYGKDFISISHLPDAIETEKAEEKIKSFNPDAIFFMSTPTPTKTIIEKLGLDFLYNKTLIGFSIYSEKDFQDFLTRRNLKFIFSSAYPRPNKTNNNVELVAEYVNNALSKNKTLSSNALEGYIIASIFIEILKQIDGPITKEKILKQAENIKDLKYKGLNFSFNPETRSIAQDLFINLSKDEYIKIEEDTKTDLIEKKSEEAVKIIPEKTSNEIILGTTLDLSAQTASIGENILLGLNLKISEQNKQGGINGKKIKLVHFDDRYNSNIAKKNIQDLINQNIHIILSPSGSRPFEGYKKQVKNKKILVLFPRITSPNYYNPDLENIVFNLPSSGQEAKILIDYIVNDLKIQKLALFYQTEPYSQGAFEEAKKALETSSLKEGIDWIGVSHLAADYKMKKIADQIKSFAPTAIVCLNISTATKSLLEDLGLTYLFDRTLAGISSHLSLDFINYINKRNLKFIVTSPFPPIRENNNYKIINEYLSALDNTTSPNEFMLEGYIAASLFIEIAKQIKGDITKEKVLEEIEKTINYNLEELKFSFNPNTHGMATEVFIILPDDKFIKKEIKQEAPTKKGPPENNILRIATLLDLSAELSDIGQPVLKGINLAISKLNESGGINGTTIKLIDSDTKYDPQVTRNNLQDLLKNGIDIILCASGSYVLNACMQQIKEQKVAFIFPESNAPIFYDQDLKSIINFSPSSIVEGEAVAEYSLSKFTKNSKFAIFYQNDPYGLGALDGVKKIFEKNNLKENIDWVAVSHDPKNINMQDVSKKIIDFNPDVILLLSLSIPTESLINELGSKFVYDKAFVGTTTYSTPSFRKIMEKRNINFANLQVIPDPETTNLEIVQNYRKDSLEMNYPLNGYSLRSYMATQFFIDVLKKIEGEITKEKIIEQIENTKDYDFKGIKLNFNPKTRSLRNTLWINEGDGKVIEYSAKKKIEHHEKEPKISSTKKSEDILIGTTMDLTAHLSEFGQHVLNGLNLRLNEANEKNEIDGKKIKLIHFDDKYNPKIALQNIETLIKKGIKILLTPVGSYTFKNYLHTIEENNILTLFPEATSTEFRDSKYKNVFHLFASSKEEGKALAKYVIENTGARKIAIFYQEDPYSESSLAGAIEVLKDNNLSEGQDWIAASHLPNTIEINSALEKIKAFDPAGIILLSVSKPTKVFLDKLGPNFLFNKQLTVGGGSAGGAFEKYIKTRNLKIVKAQLVPNPLTSDLEIAKEYRNAAEQAKPQLSESVISHPFTLEGYLSAGLFIDILNKIDGEITNEKIVEQIKNIKDYNFKGLKLNFDPKTHELLHEIWLKKPSGETETIEFSSKQTVEPELTKSKPKKHLNEILVGTTMDLSAQESEFSKAILNGLYLRINEENEKGGINGKKIKLLALDNKYNPQIAIQNIQTFMQKGIKILLMPVGSYPFKNYLPIIEKNNILTLFPEATATEFRKSEYKNVFHLLASSIEEGRALAKYIIENTDSKKIAIFKQEDPYSKSCLEGVKENLIKNDLIENEDWIVVSHLPNTINVNNAVKKIKEFNPSTILLISIAKPTEILLDKLGPTFLFNKELIASGGASGAEFENFIKKRSLQITKVQLVPDPLTSNLEIAKEYRIAAEQAEPKLNQDTIASPFTLEGYLSAGLFIDILNKIDGEITNEKIVKQIKNINDYNFKGLKLDFNPQTHELLHEIWLKKADGKFESIKLSSPTKTIEQKSEQKSTDTQDKVIKIGTLIDLSAELSDVGKAGLNGMNLKISTANESGEINNKTIKLIAQNTKYSPAKALSDLESLLKNNIDIILCASGSYILQACLPLIKEQKVAFIFPDANAPMFYKPDLKNIVNFSPSSYEEGRTITKYCLSKFTDDKKIALFYQKEPYSQGALDGAINILKEKGLKEGTNWISTFHHPQSLEMNDAVEKITNFDPDIILLLSLPIPTETLIKQLSSKNIFNKKFIGTASYAPKSFEKLMQERGLTFIHLQAAPDTANSTLEIVKEYRSDCESKGKPLNKASLEFYMATSIFIDILNKIDGKITKEKIIEQVENIKDYDFKGLKLNFNPQTRCIRNNFWINEGNNNVIEYPI